jgi:hypothetical protein
MPVAPAQTPPALAGTWTLTTKIGLAAVMMVIAVFVMFSLSHHNRLDFWSSPSAQPQGVGHVLVSGVPQTPPVAPLAPAPPAPDEFLEVIPPATFGPVIERELQARATGTNQFLNLETQQLLTPPSEIVSVLSSPGGDNAAAWEALGIPQESRRYQYIRWLQESGVDLMFAGDGKLIGFDGIFPIAHGNSSTNWDDWDGLTPEQVRTAVAVVDWSRHATQAQLLGQPPPPAPKAGGVYNSAMQVDSREPGGPVVSVLTRDQSVNWYFKTRAGRLGLLQIVGFSGNPSVARIRYKLVQSASNPGTEALAGSDKNLRELLSERLEAASGITDASQKDQPLAAVATDAAKAGEVEIAKRALAQMFELSERDTATHETVLLLVKRGLRKEAIGMAKGITDNSIRDQTLSELAQ